MVWTNPFEKFSSNWIISPIFEVKIENPWNHHRRPSYLYNWATIIPYIQQTTRVLVAAHVSFLGGCSTVNAWGFARSATFLEALSMERPPKQITTPTTTKLKEKQTPSLKKTFKQLTAHCGSKTKAKNQKKRDKCFNLIRMCVLFCPTRHFFHLVAVHRTSASIVLSFDHGYPAIVSPRLSFTHFDHFVKSSVWQGVKNFLEWQNRAGKIGGEIYDVCINTGSQWLSWRFKASLHKNEYSRSICQKVTGFWQPQTCVHIHIFV